MARYIRTEGVTSWSSAVRTAVGIYNQAPHSATGVPPNRLFLGRDLHLPGDLFRGDPLPNGSLVGGPGTIAARVQDDISVLRAVALERQDWMIARNAKTFYYIKQLSETFL